MTDRAQFEAMLEALINEDQESAKEIFHNIVVSKSREIYEELLAEDFTSEDENATSGQAGDEPMGEMFGDEEDTDSEEPADDADEPAARPSRNLRPLRRRPGLLRQGDPRVLAPFQHRLALPPVIQPSSIRVRVCGDGLTVISQPAPTGSDYPGFAGQGMRLTIGTHVPDRCSLVFQGL